MRTWIVAAAMAALGGGAAAQVEGELEGIIQSQIDAFQADDLETAFTYASPTIRGMFGTSDRFGAMVRQGYPMVWRPSRVEFQGQRAVGPSVLQRLLVTGPQGRDFYMEYQMIETDDGWKINGVQVVRAPGVGA